MSKARDTELAQELEALVAAKAREQRAMYAGFGVALLLFLAAVALRSRLATALGLTALSLAALGFGIRAHLRAAALRGQALEKILAEAFRRAGETPESNP